MDKFDKICIIEDDYTTRSVLEYILTEYGYKVSAFDSIPQESQIDEHCVLLVDVRIGARRSAGIEFAMSLPPEKMKLPLMFMSNWRKIGVQNELDELARRRGQEPEWLQKPIELDILSSEITKACEKASKRRTANGKQHKP